MIAWTQIQSSVISAAAYHGSTLYIRFMSNHEYEYYKVPQSIYEELIHASSAGQYFNAYIKNHYDYLQLK